jgi:glucose/arabinose dehydrogenase
MKSLLLGSACILALALLPNLAAAQGGDKIPLTTKGKMVAPDGCAVRCTFDKQMVEGKPVDTRAETRSDDKPAFPGQTRAPYHKTVPVKVTTLASDLDNPFALGQLPDGRFLVTEKPGRIRLLNKDGSSDKTISEGLPPILSRGQVGLLDIAVDPKFAANHRIFFTYMHRVDADNSAMAVGSAVLDEAKGALSDVKTIYQTAYYPNATAVNAGSRIAIDPKDGSLFVIMGDRSTGDPVWLAAQQPGTALGKLIHITPEGKPAPGNPAGGLPENYNSGHRSEQGLAFAPDGRLWEVEDGPRGGDELNLMKPGLNYGWPTVTHSINYPGTLIGEGLTQKEGVEEPRYYWNPVIAPSGLAFYKGTLFPQWQHSVLVGGLTGQAIFRLELGAGDKVVNEEPLLAGLKQRIRDVRVFNDGAVYAVTDGPNAKLLKLTPQ